MYAHTALEVMTVRRVHEGRFNLSYLSSCNRFKQRDMFDLVLESSTVNIFKKKKKAYCDWSENGSPIKGDEAV